MGFEDRVGQEGRFDDILVSLLKILGPIFDTRCHCTMVDEVEFLGEDPWFVAVVDEEFAVWRDAVLPWG
jgi:hypothetical protein